LCSALYIIVIRQYNASPYQRIFLKWTRSCKIFLKFQILAYLLFRKYILDLEKIFFEIKKLECTLSSRELECTLSENIFLVIFFSSVRISKYNMIATTLEKQCFHNASLLTPHSQQNLAVSGNRWPHSWQNLDILHLVIVWVGDVPFLGTSSSRRSITSLALRPWCEYLRFKLEGTNQIEFEARTRM